jgi:hypothetical protein
VGFLDIFSKKFSSINFHKNSLVGAEFFRADGQTDGLTEKGTGRQIDGYEERLIISFRNFAKAHEIDKAPHEITYFLTINTMFRKISASEYHFCLLNEFYVYF